MNTNLIGYLEDTVRRNPKRIAISEVQREYSFGELYARAQSIAHVIHNESGAHGRIVAVFLPKSAAVTISDFGIMMTGNGFMNLDVKTPIDRIGQILANVEPIAVIADEKGSAQLSGYWQGPIIAIEALMEKPYGNIVVDTPWHFFGYSPIDDDPFCIINTSGSTGVPKSVVTPFRCFRSFAQWTIEKYGLRVDEEISANISPTFFDSFVHDILLMAMIGMRQVQIPDSYRMFPLKILQRMREQGATYMLWVPTIMANVANSGLLDRFPVPTLRHCWFAGEVIPTHQINQWIKTHPNAEFVNLYGPMEVTEVCTYYDIIGKVDESKPIPIGKPIANYDVRLFREDGEVVSCVGEEGEICVRGNIAYGYYGMPEKTNAVFTQVPYNRKYNERMYHTGDYGMYDENGDIVFCGRRDSLIKHSGYRIELSEIEHVLVNKLKIVTAGCVVYNRSKKEIVLFYERDGELEIAAFQKAIGDILPKYMIPSVLIRLPQLPRGGTGKIDRATLNKRVNS